MLNGLSSDGFESTNSLFAKRGSLCITFNKSAGKPMFNGYPKHQNTIRSLSTRGTYLSPRRE